MYLSYLFIFGLTFTIIVFIKHTKETPEGPNYLSAKTAFPFTVLMCFLRNNCFKKSIGFA